jgi:hypothetical protein
MKLAFVLTSLCALCACQPVVLGPSVDGVTPNWGYNGESTGVSIQGQGFFAGVEAVGGEIGSFDRDFIVSLEGAKSIPLEGVKHLSHGRLEANVPPGVDPGWYDLTLVTPSGHTATLDDAFEVTSTRADSIRLEISRPSVSIGDVSIVRIALVDPAGLVVPEPAAIVVDLIPNSSSGAGLSIDPSGLVGAELGIGGAHATGSLNVTGEGFVGVSSTTVDDVWVQVSASIRGRSTTTARDLISFEAGSVAGVEVELPEEGWATTAGEAFVVGLRLVDSDGQDVTGQAATVALTEGCPGGTWATTHTFIDQATVSVAPTRACEANTISAFGAVDGMGIVGESAPFEVLAADLSLLDVLASPDHVSAGIEQVNLFVQGTDAWHNPTQSELGHLTVSDEWGVLTPENGNGSFECDASLDGSTQCVLWLYVAGEARVVDVTSLGGPSGSTNPIQVAPGIGHTLNVGLSETELTAGNPVEVELTVLDGFDNPLILGAVDLTELIFSDDDEAIACDYLGTEGPSRHYRFSCTLTAAGMGRRIFVTAPTMGTVGQSELFEVAPASLQTVDLTIDEDAVLLGITAGDMLLVAAEGFDAYRNRVSGVYNLGLKSVGGVSAALTLTDGVGVELVAMTVALPGESLWVTFGDLLLGGSAAFDVEPGPLSGLDVSAETLWGFVGTPYTVGIRHVDEFGNTAVTDPVPYTVSSRGGLSVGSEGVVSGSSSTQITFSTAGIGETLDIEAGPFSASISGIDVALDCETGPGEFFSIAGREEGRVCLGPGGTAEAELEWAFPSFIHASIASNGDSLYRGAETKVRLELDGPGVVSVEGFFIDNTACGVVDRLDVYAGYLGEVVGPISVVAGVDALVAGSDGTMGGADVDFSAWQCSGDAAALGSIYVRADKGDLAPMGGSTLTPDGSGLVLALDDEGDGGLYWSMAEVEAGGSAAIVASGPAGSAAGSAWVEVDGDSLPPTIITISTNDEDGSSFDTLQVRFSEAMLVDDADLTSSDFLVLEDSSGATLDLDGASFGLDSRTLNIEPGLALDDSEGPWQLLVTDAFRDPAGNRIDGDLDGVAGGDWVGTAATADEGVPDLLQCVGSAGWLRPDGDSGVGVEADHVWIDLVASSPSDWWRIDVFDDNGTRIMTDHTPRTRPLDGSVSWNGRDGSGRVVGNGRYLMEVSAANGLAQTGIPCAVSVVIENLVDPW